VELAGRRVAVIGSAASAVQTVPELAKVARHVSVFQRTPNYIAPRKDAAYGEAERQRFRRFPWLMRLHRWIIFLRLELTLFPIVRNGWFRRRLARMVRGNIGKSVADPELRRRLEPAYELGCKRILISDDYYDALQRPNVDLVTDGIRRIEPDGVRDATGRLHAADVLIYATGFDLGGHMRSIEVAGRGGRRLAEDWGDLAEAYQGVMVAGYPNYFMTTGPNTGVGTTSIIFMIEQSVGWIVRVIRRARERDALVDVRPEAQRAYNDRIQADLQKTVWASGCHSWYRREDGKIETLYPYSGRAFRRQMARVRLSDLQFREVPQNVHA
jgi:cation diffusion facilitator CzcD-associated flavoprotein CzcO